MSSPNMNLHLLPNSQIGSMTIYIMLSLGRWDGSPSTITGLANASCLLTSQNSQLVFTSKCAGLSSAVLAAV